MSNGNTVTCEAMRASSRSSGRASRRLLRTSKARSRSRFSCVASDAGEAGGGSDGGGAASLGVDAAWRDAESLCPCASQPLAGGVAKLAVTLLFFSAVGLRSRKPARGRGVGRVSARGKGAGDPGSCPLLVGEESLFAEAAMAGLDFQTIERGSWTPVKSACPNPSDRSASTNSAASVSLKSVYNPFWAAAEKEIRA